MLLRKNMPMEHAMSGGNLPVVRFFVDHDADLASMKGVRHESNFLRVLLELPEL